MTLQQLKYFVKIAECGSITEAAQELFIAQPSLSSSVKMLEAEYGLSLFNRSARGIALTPEGSEFLAYARDILEKEDSLNEHFLEGRVHKRQLAVSTHHYAFSVTAFANTVKNLNSSDEYNFTLRETRTYEILDDVASYRSEIGVLFVSDFNRKPLKRVLEDLHLSYHPLFNTKAHVFISKNHPLAVKSFLTLEELMKYPYLSFEQGVYNAFYFSEEVFSEVARSKVIHVSDRATIFNLMAQVNGYTVSTGILHNDLNKEDIVSVPLRPAQDIQIGWISNKKAVPSREARDFVDELCNIISGYGYKVLYGDAESMLQS
ncbi:MAG: LysR family transcriptional regulator [Clostridia bacterium]|nr:LysR family transcriptional regulator [Clostridia bacterium]